MSAAWGYRQGIGLYRQGRYDEAVAALAPLTGEAGLLGRLARYYQGQACRQAGLALARAGHLDAAQDYLQRTMRLIGPTADLATYLARIYTQLGMHERAEAQLEAAADCQQDGGRTLADLALAQSRAGRGPQAMMTLRAAVRKFPHSVPLHVRMGLMLARNGEHQEAAEHFRLAVEADCLHADAHYYLGLCLAAQGECVQAAGHLERALSLRPGDVVLARQLALVAQAAGEQGRPVQLSLREPTGPWAPTCLHQLAQFVAREHDFVPAFVALPPSEADEELFGLLCAILETAIEMHPRYADLRLRQALVLRRLGRLPAAVEQARQALAIHPRYRQAMILLGELLAESDPAEAAGWLERAVGEGARYPDVYVTLAEACRRLDRRDQARQWLGEALRANNNYHAAREALERLAA